MNKLKHLISLLSCLIFIFITSNLEAKESKESIDSIDSIFSMTLEELLNVKVTVWSVSRQEEESSRAAASVIVISQKQIKSRGYKDLNDVLRELPGFDIVENAGRFGDQYTIRGIDRNDRFLLLVDGHRVNPYSGTFLSTGNSISIRFAKKIEVVYGPASVVYGADAFAAIVNIITKNKETPKSSTYSVDVSKGSYGTQDIAVLAEIPFNKEDSLLTMSARFYDSDGMDLRTYDQIYANTSQYAQPIQDHTLNIGYTSGPLRFGFFEQSFNEGNGVALVPNIYDHTKSNVWKLKTDILWGEYLWQFDDDSKLAIDLSYTEHTQHPDTNFKKTPIQYMTGEDKTIKSSFIFSKTLSMNTQMVIGLETERTESIPPYANDEVFGTGNSIRFEGNVEQIIRNELTLKENRTAVFAQFTHPINDKIDIVLGVRKDHSDQNPNSVNPRGGLTYRASEKTTAKFLYGTAFQAPSLFSQYEQFVVNPLSLIMLPNTALKNQELESYEFNLTHHFSKRYLFNGSIYYNNMSNLIFRNASDLSVAGYDTVLQNTNIGKQSAIGLDLRLDAVIGKNTRAHLNYSYIDAEYQLNNITNDLPRISENKFNLGINSELSDKLSIYSQIKWVGKATTELSNSKYPNGQKMPSYLEVNAYVNYQVTDNFSLFINLKNILDKDIEHGGLLGQSGIYTPTLYQPGFNGMLGINLHF